MNKGYFRFIYYNIWNRLGLINSDEESDEETEEEEEDSDNEEQDSSKADSTLDSSKDVDMSKLSKSARRRLKKKLAQQNKQPQVNGVDKSKVKFFCSAIDDFSDSVTHLRRQEVWYLFPSFRIKLL